MIQYSPLNLKLSNLQLNKLKCGIKNVTELTLKLSSTFVGDSSDGNSFPHKLLLANTQVSKFCEAFGNGSSANVKILAGFLGRLLEPLVKSDLTLMKNVLKPLAKSVSILLGLTAAAAAATDAAIHDKMFGSVTAILKTLN